MQPRKLVLHIKRLNQTESPIFVILCVLCFQRQSVLTFISLLVKKFIVIGLTQAVHMRSIYYYKWSVNENKLTDL